jgi:hypothetical protein
VPDAVPANRVGSQTQWKQKAMHGLAIMYRLPMNCLEGCRRLARLPSARRVDRVTIGAAIDTQAAQQA